MEKQNRKRDIQLLFRVTPEEKELIQEKMNLVGMKNFREYGRQMATKGYIVNVDVSEIKSVAAELQKIDVTIRQILRHTDAMGESYVADAEEIRLQMKDNWRMVRKLFREAMRLYNSGRIRQITIRPLFNYFSLAP